MSGRGQVGLRLDLALDPQDRFADFAAAVIDDRRLPVAIVLLQLLEHRTGETEFGEGGLKLIFPLKFLCLLRGHIGFEKTSEGSTS